jgi:hypothetical protein
MTHSSTIDDIVEDFALIDDWEERYRYVIELGRALSGLPESAKTEENRVRGCASQVWLETVPDRNAAGEPTLSFNADSDAHIVRVQCARTDRDSAHPLHRPHATRDTRRRRNGRLWAAGSQRTPHPATLQRRALYGGAHSPGRACGD